MKDAGVGKAMIKGNMDQDILKVLYSEEQLRARVQEMKDREVSVEMP